MLIGQTKAEAARHEQKRATAAARLGAPGDSEAPAQAEAWNQLVTLTRRAVLMDAQVDVLDGKRRALARHRDALAELADALATAEPAAAEPTGDAPLPASGPGALPPVGVARSCSAPRRTCAARSRARCMTARPNR